MQANLHNLWTICCKMRCFNIYHLLAQEIFCSNEFRWAASHDASIFFLMNYCYGILS